MNNNEQDIDLVTKERYQSFIQLHNHCPLCGSQLELHVESYPFDNSLREEAHCGTCEVIAHIKDHVMH